MFQARTVLALVACAAMSATLTAFPDNQVAESAGDGFVLERVAGPDRIATAVAASEIAFPSGATDVVIARADDFPDALAGNYLAGQLGAPILLSGRADVPDAVVAEIVRLGASRANVLGGAGAIGPEVVRELEAAGLVVSRVFGADRFTTAAAIASTSPAAAVGLDSAGRRTAIVGSGTGFADLLTAGSLSYAAKFPVLVTPTSALPTSVSDALTGLGVEHVLLLGGPAAVSSSVQAALVDLGVVVTRLGGANRYETAVAVARFALSQVLVATDHVDVATGTAFPDALAIGPLAGKEAAMTLLVGAQPVPALCTLLAELPLVAGHLAGGPNAVSETTKAAMEACAAGTTPNLPTDGVLIIRGADRSGGFLEAASDAERTEHLSLITNASTKAGNHGWKELYDVLVADGHDVTQIAEAVESGSSSGQADGEPADLSTIGDYNLVIFGSNNAVYTAGNVATVDDYIRGGGSALFISDANWGSSWQDAPNSNQQFLDQYGIAQHQDNGVYVITAAEYNTVGDGGDPDHPVLAGVASFDGEGVSPFDVSSVDVDVTLTNLARAEGDIRLNPGNAKGATRAPTVTDSVLWVATVGDGRIAGLFDRNTFFNLNGAGTSIQRFDNTTLAKNLVDWLTP